MAYRFSFLVSGLRASGLLVFLALFFLFAIASPSRADERSSDAASVVTVIHIDAMPQFQREAAGLLAGFRRDSLKEEGARGFEVLQEIDHPNHFTLVETWGDRKAYEAHAIAGLTRRFRDRLQPMLGSPFDERLHRAQDGAR